MKSKLIIPLASVLLLLIACGNNDAAKAEKQMDNNKAPEKAAARQESTESSSSQDNGIVGKWRLTWQAFDENGNKKLDEEERKKGFSNKYFYQFNANGSCLIQSLKGNYEIKEEGGKKKLSTYTDIDGTKELIGFYTILSVNKDELLLLDASADYTFWPFKREK